MSGYGFCFGARASVLSRRYVSRVLVLMGLSASCLVRGDGLMSGPLTADSVWSGVIHWGGLWKENGELIEIEPKFEKAAKTPETVPNGFVVLGRGPFSLGEQDGEIVCPYQRMR